jgi:hypothetical protein
MINTPQSCLVKKGIGGNAMKIYPTDLTKEINLNSINMKNENTYALA